jgi:hypothetical protein
MEIQFSNHARRNMIGRGATEEEVVDVIKTGAVSQGRQGRLLATKVFTRGYVWQGTDYPHKEVLVVQTQGEPVITVVTVNTRYGFWAGVE